MLNKIKYIASKAQKKLGDLDVYNLASSGLNRYTSHEYFQLSHGQYGTHARHTFDLYKSLIPRNDQALIVFVYGGTWSSGKKEDYLFVAGGFAQEGFDVVVIDYRLAPEFVFPSYVDDLVLALNYLDDEQKTLNISTQNLILMGHSAGGFNVMSAVYHPKPYDLKCRDNIKAIVGMAGAYHFDYMGDKKLEQAFDLTKSYQQVMPYYFVEKNNIEHIFLLASSDFLVATSNTYDMNRELLAKGNKSQIHRIPRTGHASLIGSISSRLSHWFKTKDAIMTALTETLTPR